MATWPEVQSAVRVLGALFSEDVVFIGGVAVALHTRTTDLPVEYTHDADVAVGLAAWTDVRDLYEVVANRRLSKHQIVTDGVEFDVYLERNNALVVDYPALAQHAVVLEGLRTAHLEHLLVLKVRAFQGRAGSAHGAKDRRDVAKLLVILGETPPVLALPYLVDEDLAALDSVVSSAVFRELAPAPRAAAELRRRASAYARAARRALQ